jgi:hypothetical protein
MSYLILIIAIPIWWYYICSIRASSKQMQMLKTLCNGPGNSFNYSLLNAITNVTIHDHATALFLLRDWRKLYVINWDK